MKFWPLSSGNSCPLRPPRSSESLALKWAAAEGASADAALGAADAGGVISPVLASDAGVAALAAA